MGWLQLSVETDREHSEALAEFLEQFAATAISFSAASDEPLFDHCDGEDTGHWRHTRVSALLPGDVDMDILLVCLRDRIGSGHIYSHAISRLEDRDWVESFQQSQPALVFADRLCICPDWCEVPEGDYLTVKMDPGLAFGTGAHATTALCLEWLAREPVQGYAVIDYGCGSGILALAAARLGAAAVVAVDIDPQAISACESNVAGNQLQHCVRVGHPDHIELQAADILLANVLLNPLLELRERLAGLVKPGGRLVLSGLLAHQVDTCLEAYRPCFTMQSAEFRDEWALLQGVRI